MKSNWARESAAGDFPSHLLGSMIDPGKPVGGDAAGDSYKMTTIDAALRASRSRLRFDKPLEDEYEAQMGRRRNWDIAIGLWWFAVMLIGCVAVDASVQPHLLMIGATLRSLGGLLCIGAGFWVLRLPPGSVLSRIVMITPLVVGVSIVALIGKLADEPYSDRYVIAAGVVILLINTLVQLRGRDTIIFCLISLVLFEGITFADIGPPRTDSVTDIALFAPMVILSSLFFALRHERVSRRVFLLRVKDELLARELIEANARLTVMSMTDPLTGVYNRRGFDSAFTSAWTQAIPRGGWVSLLMIDVDYFKSYNDQLGHAEGDKCLAAVANALRRCLRENLDVIARYGGEEFAVVCPNLDDDEGVVIGERMRAAVEALRLEHPNRPDIGYLTVSVGLAAVRPAKDGLNQAEFIRAADAALYTAKLGGSNRVASVPAWFWKGSMDPASSTYGSPPDERDVCRLPAAPIGSSPNTAIRPTIPPQELSETAG